MALTATQKAKVTAFLGWSAFYAQTDSALNNAFGALETEPEMEALVISILTDLEAIEVKLIDAHKRLKAIRVGTIGLDEPRGQSYRELSGLRWEGMRLTGKLSSIMGVERRHNVFGSGSGPASWFGYGRNPNGGGYRNEF